MTPDIDVIKVLLLLNSRTWPGARPNVVAAVQSSANLAAARLAAGETALVIDADDIAVGLIVQSHRQSGLSTVFNELLSFIGNEIYPWTEPAPAGSTYSYSTSVSCVPGAPVAWTATAVPTGSVPFQRGDVEVEARATATDPGPRLPENGGPDLSRPCVSRY
ncbi:hypothetical protein ABZS71_30460 [Streptomyces sp. NPDC005393]|uniref:CASTOR/POLLUX-related putative ion channel n=1 Tax=Streptomyces sp. NPDC005393 TaxID=3157041 RepID=UPI0033A85CF7